MAVDDTVFTVSNDIFRDVVFVAVMGIQIVARTSTLHWMTRQLCMCTHLCTRTHSRTHPHPHKYAAVFRRQLYINTSRKDEQINRNKRNSLQNN